jgi:hypothetical protein
MREKRWGEATCFALPRQYEVVLEPFLLLAQTLTDKHKKINL